MYRMAKKSVYLGNIYYVDFFFSETIKLPAHFAHNNVQAQFWPIINNCMTVS